MAVQLTNKIFAVMTEGEPLDGQGKVVYVAGSPVTEIKRVYMSAGVFKEGVDEWAADVIAPGYHVGGSYGLVDKGEGLESATVPLASIVVK